MNEHESLAISMRDPSSARDDGNELRASRDAARDAAGAAAARHGTELVAMRAEVRSQGSQRTTLNLGS